ncbi:hypothetical protein BAOM_3151 [Peribacillus asahii]|uniref:Uncharacterized protein n=1 Tax=Peribacillus asahii TaxID=228899 RepID=A0A3T0KTY9_9BACI|nr:hypothetical protein [Peribacillus asahii]AZV43760.1 hypothetical protein BAOM_3151 [Peribacillus asahii]
MKFTIGELLNLDDEILYDYLSEKGKFHTKSDLREVAESRGIRWRSNDTNDYILNSILNKIATTKINNFLNPNDNFNYKNVHKVKEFSSEEKVRFVNKFGKYLDESDLKMLIYDETESSIPTYKELLTDVYLNLIKSPSNA